MSNVFTCYHEFAGETGPFDRFAVLDPAGRYYLDDTYGKI